MSPTPRPWASVVIPIKDERDNLTPFTKQMLTVLQTPMESPAILLPNLRRSHGAP
jgi:dolichol-phosphate mannosyltransferase